MRGEHIEETETRRKTNVGFGGKESDKRAHTRANEDQREIRQQQTDDACAPVSSGGVVMEFSTDVTPLTTASLRCVPFLHTAAITTELDGIWTMSRFPTSDGYW